MSIFTQEIERQLYQISTFLQEDIKQILLDKGHNATGELVESIKNTVSRGSDMFTIEGSMAKQGEFVINGRLIGAKGVPIDALVKWIQNKNFSNGISSTRGLAFAIQKSIKKKGIKPDDFIGEVFDKNKGLIERKLDEAVGNALTLSLTNLVNNAQQFA
tara:strand:+ start:2623 stop:3099 length:477 start_codon:yes stop_codon:yes gene_type:complete